MNEIGDVQQDRMDALLGYYTHPLGLLEYIGSLPFLGRITCEQTHLEAGSWHELVLDYEVGSSGLADGGWLKITFKFYSDWALFQTGDPTKANYVSAEYQARPTFPGESPATVQSLHVRFDQKGHERPFQKAILIDIVDGYLKPGDHVIIRLGDRRGGGPGTRVQTFVEEKFRFRAYIDPVGTSRFAAIPGDVTLDIVPGPPARVVTIVPPLVQPHTPVPITVRLEDRWGNTCWNTGGIIQLKSCPEDEIRAHNLASSATEPSFFDSDVASSSPISSTMALTEEGWAIARQEPVFPETGRWQLQALLAGTNLCSELSTLVVERHLPFEKPFFADLHVHSNSTVGTNSTEYNFTYGRDVVALDILGYTANDFHITGQDWERDVALCRQISEDNRFICYPGTEWCGNSAVGGDHNVVFLGEEVLFPTGRRGEVVRSFEWNEHMSHQELIPGTWPIDELYAAYIHDAEQHLLIPHVGGRRALPDWHHPRLERLIEIGSSWGHFPWLYQEAIERGYKLGVSAAGDEHRGRCGGGVPGTAVFGVKGGLTGVIAPVLTKQAISHALRSRHTWATTGERNVALLWCENGIQGDECTVSASRPLTLSYRFTGGSGWENISAYTDEGLLWTRNLHKEQGFAPTLLRLRWGGARIRDRYRAAEWTGTLTCTDALIQRYQAYGLEHQEEYVRRSGPQELSFRSDTYGDADSILMEVSDLAQARFAVDIRINGYTRVGDPLAGNPYLHRPHVSWQFTGRELLEQESLLFPLGGTDLFLAAERVSRHPLPRDVQGQFHLQPREGQHGFVPVYLTGQQIDDAKAWTSPLFVTFA